MFFEVPYVIARFPRMYHRMVPRDPEVVDDDVVSGRECVSCLPVKVYVSGRSFSLCDCRLTKKGGYRSLVVVRDVTGVPSECVTIRSVKR